MLLLLTTMILHLLKYSLISAYNLTIILVIYKHIKLNKLFLLELRVIRLIALLNS
jgi:hypothetical protein